MQLVLHQLPVIVRHGHDVEPEEVLFPDQITSPVAFRFLSFRAGSLSFSARRMISMFFLRGKDRLDHVLVEKAVDQGGDRAEQPERFLGSPGVVADGNGDHFAQGVGLDAHDVPDEFGLDPMVVLAVDPGDREVEVAHVLPGLVEGRDRGSRRRRRHKASC